MTDITRISEAEIDRLAATGDVWDAEPVKGAPLQHYGAAEVKSHVDPELAQDIDEALTDLENDPKPVFEGFNYRQLSDAFEAVRAFGDWKARILAYVSAKNLAVIEAAIVFFTATEPTVTPVPGNWYRIEAAGYRMGPAGDH